MSSFSWNDPNRLLDAVTKMLAERGTAIRQIPGGAVRRAAPELTALVKENTPKVTSTLVRTINFVIQDEGGGLVIARIGTHMRYARFVEEGTGIYGPKKVPIVIEARNKKALFWGLYLPNEKTGKDEPVFRRRVTIKGMKPRRMFATSAREFLPRYLQIIEQELAREAAR